VKVLYGPAILPDIFYRVRWSSDVEVLYIEDGEKKTLYVPGFEYARAKKEVLKVTVEQLVDAKQTIAQLPGEITVDKTFPHWLASAARNGVRVDKELFSERRVKTKDELAAIQAAQEAASQAITLVKKRLAACEVKQGVAHYKEKPMTSEALKTIARTALIKKGFDCPDLIISSGEQTALPHHRGSGEIKEGPVIIDVFPRSEKTLYHGDMTRTVILGEHAAAERMLKAVRTVFSEAAMLCVPGGSAAEVHTFVERRLLEMGFPSGEGRGLIHSAGHGIGLEVHEPPFLRPSSEEKLLEGTVVALEPALYGAVGVRHENLVIVSKKPAILFAD
jgi:Xaa-Pro aminopeptidase